MSAARELAKAAASFGSGGFAGYKNYIINPFFEVWQRGTSFSGGNTVDRWNVDARNGLTISVGRGDTAPVYPTFPSKYFANVTFSPTSYAADSVERGIFFNSWIENGFANLRGKTVTLTIYADTNQDFAIGFGNIDSTLSQGGTSPSWRKLAAKKFSAVAGIQKYVFTFTLPSLILGTDAYRDHLLMWFAFGCNQHYANAGFGVGNITAFNTTGSYFNILAIQLEEGSESTRLERRPPGLDLSLCQRYLPVIQGANYSYPCAGLAQSTTVANVNYVFKVTPRVKPTGLTVVGVAGFGATTQASGGAASSMAFQFAGLDAVNFYITTNASFTTGMPLFMTSSSDTSSIQFTGCEL